MEKIPQSLEVKVQSEAGEVVVISDEAFRLYTEDRFSDFVYDGKFDKNLTNEENTNNAASRLGALWELWKSQNIYGWGRMYDAIMAKYSPIENVEEIIEPYKVSTEMHKGSKTVSTPGVKTTTTSTPGTKVEREDFVYGGNDPTNPSPEGKTTSKESGNSKTETEHVGNDTVITTDVDPETFDHTVVNNDLYRRHGNIGVTKSTELVESELALRVKTQLGLEIIKSFIFHFCFYSTGLEVVE